MIKEFIGTGKTIEEATLAAKTGLNAPAAADIKIEVVTMPAKKFLGLFGGSDAQVKASYEDGKKEKKPQPRKDAPKKDAQKAALKKDAQKRTPVKKEAPKPEKAQRQADKPREKENKENREKAVPANMDLDYACNYLRAMLNGMQIQDAEISAELKDGVVEMEVHCDDYGIIIGRRGDTLDALQYLTSLAIKKQTDQYVRVTLNVGNYREKRVETLKNLARKNADYVLRTGRRYTFEPMNPYERRIIHTSIQEIEGVESKSVGYDQNRRVVLEPTGGVKSGGAYSNGPKRGGRSRSNGNAAGTGTKPAVAPKADRSGMPKFGKIEVNKE